MFKIYFSSIKSSFYRDEVFIINAKLDYPAIKFGRTLYLKPNQWLIVQDDLNFERPRKATQWFHLEKNYNLISLKDGHGLFKKDKSNLL